MSRLIVNLNLSLWENDQLLLFKQRKNMKISTIARRVVGIIVQWWKSCESIKYFRKICLSFDSDKEAHYSAFCLSVIFLISSTSIILLTRAIFSSYGNRTIISKSCHSEPRIVTVKVHYIKVTILAYGFLITFSILQNIWRLLY